MSIDPVLKDKILSALRQVQDPALKRDIVALGMVKDIQSDGGNVFVQLESQGAGLAAQDEMKAVILQKLKSVSGVLDATLQFTTPEKRGSAFQPKMPIPGIRYVIAVASGKGGVGKSTVTVNLALAIAAQGYRVGIMDGDIYGPNIPLMLGVSPGTRPQVNPEGKIIPVEALGLKMISMALLVPADQPMVWRGPMLHSAVTQFVQKVEWGELDYLLVDLPPGTGDVQLSLVQTVSLSGALIVTTPQEVALMDVRKGILMFQKTEVPILGIIENMTGEVFGAGGGKETARQFETAFLGEIPLDAKIRLGGDSGKPVFKADPGAAASQAFRAAAEHLTESLLKTAEPRS